MANSQNIELVLQKAIESKLSKLKIQNAIQAVKTEILNIIIDRTSRGIDLNGNPFKAYSKGYERFKRRFISGGAASKTKRLKGSKGIMVYKDSKFSAKSLPDWIRLSGNTMGHIAVNVLGSTNFKLNANSKLKVEVKMQGSTFQKRAEYIQNGRRPRTFLGLSVSGSEVSKERERIAKAFFGGLGASGNDFKINVK